MDFFEILKNENHWDYYYYYYYYKCTTQDVFLPYLFLNCWNSEKLNLKIAKPHFASCSKSGDQPQEDLAKFGYKTTIFKKI
jgi:hypothetical protein